MSTLKMLLNKRQNMYIGSYFNIINKIAQNAILINKRWHYWFLK